MFTIFLIFSICIVVYALQLLAFYYKPYRKFKTNSEYDHNIGGLLEYCSDKIGDGFNWYALLPFLGPLVLLVTFIRFGLSDAIKNIKL